MMHIEPTYLSRNSNSFSKYFLQCSSTLNISAFSNFDPAEVLHNWQDGVDVQCRRI